MKKVRGIFVKNENEIAKLRQANRLVARILDALGREVRPGVATMHFEEVAQEMCRNFGVRPAFQGYAGFPFALCCSVNEEVVHGFPSRERVLREGDVVSFDMGVIYDGFYGDSARTYPVGTISAEAQRLLDVTRKSLEAGIGAVKAGMRLYDVSAVIEKHAQESGLGVVKRFVGHGVGRALHEKPEVPNFVPRGLKSPILEAGMVIAIEPMFTLGTDEVDILADNWTAVTRDRSYAAHFEHTIAVTHGGAQILSDPA